MIAKITNCMMIIFLLTSLIIHGHRVAIAHDAEGSGKLLSTSAKVITASSF